ADRLAISVAVAGDETVSRLNREYLGRDEPTDVLAFPFASPGLHFVVPSDGIRRLGDVIVCYPQAARQADELGHSAREETVLLVIHGVLHLLGYDDETPGAAAVMTRRQEELWAMLK
ncbi:MAG: rRNA maturation RNase YbeY, partial [Chloroflexota bacterium]